MTETADRRVRIEPSEKRVRAYLDGQLVVDASHPFLVWESPRYPTYYFRPEDLRAELVPTGTVRRSPSRGDGAVYDVVVTGATAPAAAVRHLGSPTEPLGDLVRLDWSAMTEWFEEDEVVYTHPRDPYTRVDILASSRNVRVEVGGVVVADSNAPRMLFETGLPTRYYLPLTDVSARPPAAFVVRDVLPVQGCRDLPLARRRRVEPARRRLDATGPAAGEPEDRRARELLQRARRRLRGRGAPGSTIERAA